MSLSIKNEKTHRMAREIGQSNGGEHNVAVSVAIGEPLERIRSTSKEGLAEPLLKIGKECAAHFKEPYKSIDHGDLLYDENGLPK